MQEQELFQSYEIKNWDYSPRLYKIIGVSAAINILALIIVGQTNLLTRKGCDSPFVGKVCSVLDTLYVGGKVLTTESEYASKDYEPTELSDSDEIIFVNVADKLYYPEGYFALSNPELALMNMDGTMPTDGSIQNIPGIPNPTTGGTNDLLNKPAELPQANPNAVQGKIPDLPYSLGNNPTTNRKTPIYRPKQPKNLNNDSPNKLPKFNTDQTADKNTDKQNNNKTEQPKNNLTPENEDVPKENKDGIFINKKPLKTFAENAKKEVKNVKLDAPFTVVISADLDYGKDGKTVVLKNPKPVKTEVTTPNDAQMAKLAQDAILAVGDSGWLGYLKILGAKKITFTLIQDTNEIKAIIQADYENENKAKTGASTLGAFIFGGRLATEGDEKVLLENAKSTYSEGTKSSILNFTIPKQIAQEMIKRKLEEAEEKKNQSNNAAQVTENNQNTVK